MARANPPSSRELKKAETRRRLISAAQDEFLKNSYAKTTLEAVAAAANVHVQTLYRHFPTKLDLAMAGERAYLQRFANAISAPDRPANTFAFWRHWLVRTITRLERRYGKERYRRLLSLEAEVPGGALVMSQISNSYEELLAEALAVDFGLPAKDMGPPRLVACMLLGAHGSLLRRYGAEDFDLKREALAVVDRVEALVSHLLDTRG